MATDPATRRRPKARPRGAARTRPRPAADDPYSSTQTALPELLAALAAAVPSLPGARCRNRWELFDATIVAERGGDGVERRDYARAAATRLCNQCPALTACRDWLERLPANERPSGVVAGRVTTNTDERPTP